MKMKSNSFTFRFKDKLTFTGVLTIVFIALKVTNCIDWPWFYVTIPLWGKWIIQVFVGIVMDMFDEDGEP